MIGLSLSSTRLSDVKLADRFSKYLRSIAFVCAFKLAKLSFNSFAFDAISYKVADNSLGISSVLERLFKFPDRGAETLSASAANVVNAPVIL